MTISQSLALAATPDTNPLERLTAQLKRNWSATFAATIVILTIVAAVTAPWLTSHDPLNQDLRNQLVPPFGFSGGGTEHLLGTDQLGRDVLARLIYGARVSLIVGFTAVIISGSVGVILGVLSGYYGGLIDIVLMRIVDLQLTFPFILLALLVLAVFGGGLVNIVIVLSITGWAIYARVLRAEVMSAREHLYVEAARSVGMRDSRLLFRHILPNVMSSLIVLATLSVAAMIVQEAALSFLGLGIPPDQPSWGGMLAEGRDFLTTAWWLGVFPGFSIFFVVLSMNMLGDWLRDYMDPKTQQN